MRISKKTNLAELNAQMESISKAFFESKAQKKKKEFLNDYYDGDDFDTDDILIERVECVYAQLDPLEQEFINNEYFYEDYPYWWTGIYSESSFYRQKKKAVISFLRLFYNESLN